MGTRREPERPRQLRRYAASPGPRPSGTVRPWETDGPAHRIRITRDPVAIVREIIEASDGVERSVVVMLAEDEGLTRATAGTTIDRLVREGSVRSARGPDGEEVYAWEPRARAR